MDVSAGRKAYGRVTLRLKDDPAGRRRAESGWRRRKENRRHTTLSGDDGARDEVRCTQVPTHYQKGCEKQAFADDTHIENMRREHNRLAIELEVMRTPICPGEGTATNLGQRGQQ